MNKLKIMLNKNNWKQYLFFPLLGLLLIGCRVGKEYQRPELETPSQFKQVSYADTSSIADIEWKQFFTDPTLQQLIAKGIQYNHDLLVALKHMDMAQQQVKQSKSANLPEIGLFFTGQINRPSDNSLNGISLKSFLGKSYVEYYAASVNISWEADIWGKIRGQKEVALTEYLRTTEAAKAVQTQLVADIAHDYYNLLMLDKQMEIARRNLVFRDSFLVVTRLLKDAGLENALAVEQAEFQKKNISLLILGLEQDIALQENALQILTGQLPGPVTRTSRLDAMPVADSLPTGLPIAMVSRRPDVRASELSLISANALVGIAQANMYPALTLTAGGGLESFKASNWFNVPGSLFGLAAGAIAQPILRRRELKTQFEIAKLEREASVIQFRQSVLNASAEVMDALVQVEKLKQQRQIAIEQVDTLRNSVRNAYLLFGSDMATYLEVLTVQTNVLAAELFLASVRRSEQSAIVDLYRSLGGGWR